MSKKKKPTEPEPEVTPTTEPRSKDRHKPRRSCALPPDVYDLLQELAAENSRPLNWELRLAVINHLKQAGKWPDSGEEKEG